MVRIIEAVECAFGDCGGGVRGEAVMGGGEDDAKVIVTIGRWRARGSKNFGIGIMVM